MYVGKSIAVRVFEVGVVRKMKDRSEARKRLEIGDTTQRSAQREGSRCFVYVVSTRLPIQTIRPRAH